MFLNILLIIKDQKYSKSGFLIFFSKLILIQVEFIIKNNIFNKIFSYNY